MSRAKFSPAAVEANVITILTLVSVFQIICLTRSVHGAMQELDGLFAQVHKQ